MIPMDVNLALAGLLFDLAHVAGEKEPRGFGYKRAAKAVLRLYRQITPLVTSNNRISCTLATAVVAGYGK